MKDLPGYSRTTPNLEQRKVINPGEILWIIFISTVIVIGLDLLTNSIDTKKNAWDFLYYISMAKDGFSAKPLASPFAYRYLTPLLVHVLLVSGFSIEQGFGSIAYLGAIAQLVCIFFFVNWLSGLRKGAYMALGVTALSLFNVKFLLFDIYRPDHLAYALIVLQTFFAFKRRFTPLLLITLFASQIREFNIIPLVAYLFMRMSDDDKKGIVLELITSMAFLLPVIVLPRIFIPVTENYQIVGLSKDGIVTALLLPLIPSVTINFIFSIVAYLIPLLFIASPKSILAEFAKLPKYQQRYLTAYTLLVMLLSFYGGTDFFRFATFLFLPQVILVGGIINKAQNIQIGFMLISMILFNRIWMQFPDGDIEKYRDFYGGFSLRLNVFTLYRILECVIILIFGYVLRNHQDKIKAKPLVTA